MTIDEDDAQASYLRCRRLLRLLVILIVLAVAIGAALYLVP